jgi:broad specificity phosphatase PhoE
VRHGETALNAAHRFQGRSDAPLSERGRQQAGALALALRDEPLMLAIASDLQRALETARVIAEPHGLSVTTDARLREFDFGLWEGLTWSEIVARFPELATNPPTAARNYAPPGGEAFDAVEARVSAFLKDLRALPADARVLVVTHAGPLHAVFSVLTPEGLDSRRVAFANASITRIAVNGERALVSALSDVSHLEGVT